MLWDGAGFHTSKQLCVPENVTPIQLPAYSPELNPIENLWHFLKSHYWSNHAHDDYEALEAAAIAAWRHAVLDPELMKTVCAAPYLERANSPRVPASLHESVSSNMAKGYDNWIGRH